MLKYDKCYDKIFQKMNENNCVLLTSREDFTLLRKEKGKSSIKVVYKASCGHKNNVFTNVFLNRLTGVLCPSCKNIDIAKKLKERSISKTGQSVNMIMEDNTINYIKELISNDFTLKKACDGCLADCFIRPNSISENKWLMVQVKTTEKQSRDYGFKCSSLYKNCIIFCFCISDKKMWILNGNEIIVSQKIGIGLKKSKYEKNEVTIETIKSTLLEYYNSMTLFKYDDVNIPISIYQKKEQEFRKFIEYKIPTLMFEYSERSGLVFDYIINGFKVQEKIGYLDKNKKYILFTIHKNNGREYGKRKFQPYQIGDNDFYWLNFPDKTKFFIFPEKILIDKGFISTPNNIGKKMMKTNLNNLNDEYMFDFNNLDLVKLNRMFNI